MRRFVCFVCAVALACSFVSAASAETEQEIVDRYLKKAEKVQLKKLSWLSVNYQMDRINRNNDYNSFANYTSNQFSNADIPWLGQANTFGIDFGVAFKNKFAWTIGGEYWLTMGIDETGTFDYTNSLGASIPVENLKSEIQVYGVSTGLQYFLMNPPKPTAAVQEPTVRLNATVGYYHAKWDLWDDYENLNLATSTSTGSNTTFEGTAPGFSLGFGGDYPLNFFGLAFGADFSYLYLNFTNIAWYNSQDEEIVVTYNNAEDGRVDLGLSGFRGKVELKRYFTF